MFARVAVIAGVIGLSAVTLACGGAGPGAKTPTVDIDRASINALAADATADAQAMEAHAATMTASAGARPDYAHWASDAGIISADARTLRFLADAALAIGRDPGSHPGSAVQPSRIYGDGINLQQLGETLIAHAGAMDAHLTAMRDQVSDSDPSLLAAIDSAASGLERMKRDGQMAADRGKELQELARRIAASTGQQLG